MFFKKPSGIEFLIVGLGNPGRQYEHSHHNAGFLALDHLADRLGCPVTRAKFQALTGQAQLEGHRVLLMKPQTFMNLSGNSVVKAAAFYKIPPQNVIVIHDDMDLQPGQLKAKLGGGSGGHNGIKSIDAHITPGYNRVRIGVGHPSGKGEKVVSHVLSGFSKDDKKLVDEALETAAATIGVLIKDGIGAYSNQIGMLKSRQKNNS